MAETVVDLRNVWFTYDGENYAVKDVSFKIPRGEFAAIIGNNGSGKTTLLKLILGLLKPTRGEVWVAGVNTKNAKVSELAKRIGLVFQNPNEQLFAVTVREEIEFGLKNLKLPREEIDKRVEEVVELFNLRKFLDLSPRFLSRGDKQKVALAAVVAMKPEIMLMDEPTTGQDHRDSRQVMDLAKRLNEEMGMTIILVTHQIVTVAEYAKRVILMNNGVVVKDDDVRSVLTDIDALASCSLLPPQITLLSNKLKPLGINNRIVKVDEMVEEIWRCVNARSRQV